MFDEYTGNLLLAYYGIIIPTIAVFGVIGNIFTLSVLLRYATQTLITI